jgi:hypothetical protein
MLKLQNKIRVRLNHPSFRPLLLSEAGKSEKLWFGESVVQDWRSTQEDAELALPEFEANASLFGVFNGHKGAVVDKFVEKKFRKLF